MITWPTSMELRYYECRAKLARWILCRAELHADRWSCMRPDARVAITVMRPCEPVLDLTIDAHDFTLDDLMTAIKYARELRVIDESLRLEDMRNGSC